MIHFIFRVGVLRAPKSHALTTPYPQLITGLGRLRTDLLDTLGLFLETDCFLEIALPTTVHLILPPTEKIVFVDHVGACFSRCPPLKYCILIVKRQQWWIWQPPFNSTFVRQKWEEGYEVDTFHTSVAYSLN